MKAFHGLRTRAIAERMGLTPRAVRSGEALAHPSRDFVRRYVDAVVSLTGPQAD
jgi:hypothetical protein